MAMVTWSFRIDEKQLDHLRALASRLGVDTSEVARALLEAGCALNPVTEDEVRAVRVRRSAPSARLASLVLPDPAMLGQATQEKHGEDGIRTQARLLRRAA